MSCASQTIRDLNDRFRAGNSDIPGRLMLTSGVLQLAERLGEKVEAIIKYVSQFDQFDEDNDPYGEHDFGAFDYGSESLFWKIDYFAPDLAHGSQDPADSSVTVRVLTIMLASEY